MAFSSILGSSISLNSTGEISERPLTRSSPIIQFWREFFSKYFVEHTFNDNPDALNKELCPIKWPQCVLAGHAWIGIATGDFGGIDAKIFVTPYNPEDEFLENHLEHSLFQMMLIVKKCRHSVYGITCDVEGKTIKAQLDLRHLISFFSSLLHTLLDQVQLYSLMLNQEVSQSLHKDASVLQRYIKINGKCARQILKCIRDLRTIFIGHRGEGVIQQSPMPSLLALSLQTILKMPEGGAASSMLVRGGLLTAELIKEKLIKDGRIQKAVWERNQYVMMVIDQRASFTMEGLDRSYSDYIPELDLMPMLSLVEGYEEAVEKALTKALLEKCTLKE
ncbi:hypothetical protein CLAVI_000312 [Candidatus Clavichlamydia salmonicola]|uniref:hypothetical protein n=1 Tax=Candidatus Clavichlamydia salmonicola TaxID=469812 RepID=UPI00189138C8|nr:hypothetical protein [Candidatus Clavichlamydia salmonicola]MBF5050697.1 hypothetical protein [Candidatus Clavichlamydia salmonicola]